MAKAAQSAATSIALPRELDMNTSSRLAAELIAARRHHLRLDASMVERVGAQCLQVLLSATSTWKVDGMELTIADPSTAFEAALSTAGLDLNHLTARKN